MLLWLFCAAVAVSATFILALSLGPLKTAGNVRTLRMLAFGQYAAAAVLAAARVTGAA